MMARTEPTAVELPIEQKSEPVEEVITPEVVVEETPSEPITAVVPATTQTQKVKAGVLSGIGAAIMSAMSSL